MNYGYEKGKIKLKNMHMLLYVINLFLNYDHISMATIKIVFLRRHIVCNGKCISGPQSRYSGPQYKLSKTLLHAINKDRLYDSYPYKKYKILC